MEPRRYTFLHSDIAESSPAWERTASEMSSLVDHIFSVIRQSTERHAGRVYKSLGDGLACVFANSADAVKAAADIQLRLGADKSRLRIGIHVGEATEVEMDFMGACLNRVSRITNAGHAGQILISEEAWCDAESGALDQLSTLDLGSHLTKGHQVAERIFQVRGPHLPESFPPLRNVVGLSSLPRPLTPVIGRQADISVLQGWLSHPSNRLTTILGFGGIGKTTCAMELAHQLRSNGLGRIWWVECEGVSSEDQLWQEIRLALGVHDPGFDPCTDLAALTHHAEVVLVLDCFERMASHGRALLRLLQGCPMLRLLVTSRVALDLVEERIYRLTGLIDLTKKRPSLVHAVELFCQAAERTLPNFAPNRRDKASIGEIVRLAEGIPLAILLAACRTASMSLPQLRDRLHQSILQTAKRTTLATGRHANLRTVIDASFALLDETQKLGLEEAAVFRGGFTAGAARAVLSHPEPEDVLAGLYGNSLVAGTTARGQFRFRLLDSVIEYVDEIVDPAGVTGGQTAARERHIDFFSRELERFREAIARDEWREVGRFLEEERGNISQAIWVLGRTSDSQRIVRLAESGLVALLERGYHAEFESLAQMARQQHESVGDDAALERVLGLLTVYARRKEKWLEAQRLASDRALVARRLGQLALVVQSTAEALTAATESEDVESIRRTWPLFQEARTHVEEDEESRVSYDSLSALALAWIGSRDEAIQLRDVVSSKLMDLELPVRSHFYPLVMLGRTNLRLGEMEDAQDEFLELLVRALAEELPHPVSLAAYGLYCSGVDQGWRGDALNLLRALPKREAPRVAGFLHRIEQAGDAIPKTPFERPWGELAHVLLDKMR